MRNMTELIKRLTLVEIEPVKIEQLNDWTWPPQRKSPKIIHRSLNECPCNEIALKVDGVCCLTEFGENQLILK